MASNKEKALFPAIFLVVCYALFFLLVYVIIKCPEKFTLCWYNIKTNLCFKNKHLISIVPVQNNDDETISIV